MAERNSTSKARSGRKLSVLPKERMPRARRTRVLPSTKDKDVVLASETPTDAERARLMRAESLLGCIAFSLMYADWREEEGPDYANAVEVARQLVRDSISALEQQRSPVSRDA